MLIHVALFPYATSFIEPYFANQKGNPLLSIIYPDSEQFVAMTSGNCRNLAHLL